MRLLLEFVEYVCCSLDFFILEEEDFDWDFKFWIEVVGDEFVFDFVFRSLNDESKDVGVVSENENGDFGFVFVLLFNKFLDDFDFLVGWDWFLFFVLLCSVIFGFFGMVEKENVLSGGFVVFDW